MCLCLLARSSSRGSCFSPQIYALLSAFGSLECDDVCNLRAAETGLDESSGIARISILNKASGLLVAVFIRGYLE